ncbi:MAG: hypothetical protein ACHQ4H_03420 [Ktedonobacterales bacterium]
MPAHVRLHPLARLARELQRADERLDDGPVTRTLAVFARLWPFLRALWLLAVPIATVVAALWIARGGDWRTLAAPSLASAAVVVAAALTWYAALAHVALRVRRHRRLAAVYCLQRVRGLRPSEYVPRYVASVYLPRRDVLSGADADTLACDAAHAAIARMPASPLAPLGLCIYGRAGQGKSRLAWEVAHAALAGWTLLRWPHDPVLSLDPATLRARRVILWLDNAHEFATPTLAATLNDLPRRFAAHGIPFVVVATCRDGKDEAQARCHLASLLDRLAAIRLADLTPTEADHLTAGLEKAGAEAFRDEFAGTPGSVVLGLRRMRRTVFPALSEPARLVLDSLTLLRSARIYAYPVWRIRATSVDLFDLPAATWDRARGELVRAGFLRAGSPPEVLIPFSDAYLDYSVPDYLTPNAESSDDWPALFESFERHRDVYGLASLGNALTERFRGIDLFMASNPRHDKELGVLCFRAEIEACDEAEEPRTWAMAQLNLGRALAGRAEVAERLLRADFRRQALAAYRLAGAVLTPRSAPAHWALAQFSLAAIARDRGADALYGGDVETACTQFAEARRYASSALAFYTPETDPTHHREAHALRESVEVALRELGGYAG